MKKILLTLQIALGAIFANAQIIKQGDITASETWTNDNIYILNGFVYVKAPAVLTIEPGTIIKGDFNSKGTLIIERGAKIIAQGTPEMPIVFTSQKNAGQRNFGDWGGLMIAGNASLNQPGGTATFEGGVGTIYGGGANPNDDDSSGVVSYVRIEFGGIAFQPNSEVNGLTLGAVGRKTKIDHVQVSYTGDDAFEWFGGTVNAKYLIAHRNWDDDFDTDFGFRGKIQYGLVLRDPAIADQSGSNGFESDNDATGTTNTPITEPTFSNITVIGPYSFNSTINPDYKRALHLRRNTRTSVFNSVFTGYPFGLLIDGSSTHANATNNDLKFKNNVLCHMADTLAAASSGANVSGAFNITNWYNAAGQNNTNINQTSQLGYNNISLTAPDMTLSPSSPLTSGADFTDSKLQGGFFETTTYRGAMNSEDWTKCWAEWNPQNENYNNPPYNRGIANFTISGGENNFQVYFTPSLTGSGLSYHWDFGDGNTSNVQDPLHTYATPNTYNVTCTITNAAGCSRTANYTIVVTSVNELHNEFGMGVYPNPTSGISTISVSLNQASEININILDITGRQVMNVINTDLAAGKYNYNVDMSGVPNGVYFANITTKFGMQTVKIVKQ
jgi:PKD repeat protein